MLGALGVGASERVAFEASPSSRRWCRAPERLRDIEELIERLGARAGADDEAVVIPEDFRRLWETFQEALRVENGA